MGLTRKKNVDNGLVRRIFGKRTDEISKPTLHWATEQLSQQHHHLVPFSAFTVQVLMKVRLNEFTGDQVGQYVGRFDVLHEVVVSLNDYIIRCLLLETRDSFQLFFHGTTTRKHTLWVVVQRQSGVCAPHPRTHTLGGSSGTVRIRVRPPPSSDDQCTPPLMNIVYIKYSL